MHGGFDPRRAPVPVRAWQRFAFVLARGLVRLRVGASTVTTIGLVCALAVPGLVLLRGWWILLAGVVAAVSALADSVDSGVALLSMRTTGMGSFYDAMADRCSELAWLVALWLLGAPGPLVAACGAIALLHEYARSRASLAGMARVGAFAVAERPTRVLVVVVALLVGAPAWLIGARLAAGVVTVALAVWLVLGVLGATRLLSNVRRHLR